MQYPENLGSELMRLARPALECDMPDHTKLRHIWAVLTNLQGMMISRLLFERLGGRVFTGPFRGMKLISENLPNHFGPAILGTYEWELHGAIEAAIKHPYKYFVDVGCAYGYYAVGMALRMPQITVYAYDIDPHARTMCRQLAELNGVSDRVIIRDSFTGADYETFAADETLLLMDIEGGEVSLLDPEAYPACAKMDIVVELHDVMHPAISTILPAKFAATHNLQIISNAPFSFPLEKISGLGIKPDHFDNVLVTWEGRDGSTPYGVFIRK